MKELLNRIRPYKLLMPVHLKEVIMNTQEGELQELLKQHSKKKYKLLKDKNKLKDLDIILKLVKEELQ